MAPLVSAVISDIHANLEALDAVLDDMMTLGVTRTICLGDIVGYGPDPADCLRTVRELGCAVVRGNHDQSVFDESAMAQLNDYARAGILHARSGLGEEERGFLASLPMRIEDSGILYVHGSVHDGNPWEYVLTPEDYLHQLLDCAAGVVMLAHTHRPAIFRLNRGGFRELEPEGRHPLEAEARYVVNAGSVGQPRNHRPHACYVVHRPDEPSIEFRYVRYDHHATARKIRAAGLPKFLGQRLALGR